MTRSKRQQILEGMLEAVGAQGYESTSVRSVLIRAGAYRQAFYDNFEDKRDCYLQALDFGAERVEALVRGASASEPSWRGQMRAGLLTLLRFLDLSPNVGRSLLVEVHAAGPLAVARRQAVFELAEAQIDRARLEAGDAAPAIAAEAVAGGIYAVLHTRLATRADSGFSELLQELMYLAVLPFFGHRAASEELR